MATAKDPKTQELHDKRMEIGIRAAELQLEVLKINRELLKSGHSPEDIAALDKVAFAW
jgi:hypothetical protein